MREELSLDQMSEDNKESLTMGVVDPKLEMGSRELGIVSILREVYKHEMRSNYLRAKINRDDYYIHLSFSKWLAGDLELWHPAYDDMNREDNNQCDKKVIVESNN